MLKLLNLKPQLQLELKVPELPKKRPKLKKNLLRMELRPNLLRSLNKSESLPPSWVTIDDSYRSQFDDFRLKTIQKEDFYI